MDIVYSDSYTGPHDFPYDRQTPSVIVPHPEFGTCYCSRYGCKMEDGSDIFAISDPVLSLSLVYLGHVDTVSFDNNPALPDIVTLAIEKGIIQNLPKTDDVCRLLVENNGMLLSKVPYTMRTSELCETAVSHNGAALHAVPNHHKTFNVCLTAVSNYGWALKDVPEEFRDSLIDRAIIARPTVISLLSKDELNEERCHQAVSLLPSCLGLVPKEFRTETLCMQAVREEPRVLTELPLSERTSALCHIAVRKDAEMLFETPDEHWTDELCASALKSAGGRLYDRLPADIQKRHQRPKTNPETQTPSVPHTYQDTASLEKTLKAFIEPYISQMSLSKSYGM